MTAGHSLIVQLPLTHCDSALEPEIPPQPPPSTLFHLLLSVQEEKAGLKLAPGEASLAAAEIVHGPEDSVYYHPTLNPLGLPPPGKAQRWVAGGTGLGMVHQEGRARLASLLTQVWLPGMVARLQRLASP